MANTTSVDSFANPRYVPLGPSEMPRAYETADTPVITYDSQANQLTTQHEVRLSGRLQVLRANDQIEQVLHDVAAAPCTPSPSAPPHDLQPQSSAAHTAPKGNPDSATPHVRAASAAPQGVVARLAAQACHPEEGPRRGTPVQLEGPQVRVLREGTEHAVLTQQDGHLTGDAGVTSSYESAEHARALASQHLGREVSFSRGQKLTLALDNRPATLGGPATSMNGVALALPSDSRAETDADVVAHETGHALLMAHRPEYNQGESTGALHEAFGDGVALFTALDDSEVRRDLAQAHAHGHASTLASNLGEGYERSVFAIEHEADANPPSAAGAPPPKPVHVHPPSARTGIRDLSARAPQDDEDLLEPHEGARQFGHGLYQSVLAVSDQLRKANPSLTADAAVEQASRSVGSDFMRSLDFLPVGPEARQGDLAQAMIQANQIDQHGSNAAIYRREMAHAGVALDRPEVQAHGRLLHELSGPGGLELPQGLRSAPGFRIDGPPVDELTDPTGLKADSATWRSPMSPERRQATEFLQQHAARLGVDPKGLRAQELMHNDRGETFIYYNNGDHRFDTVTDTYVGLGFDAQGKLIAASTGQLDIPHAPTEAE